MKDNIKKVFYNTTLSQVTSSCGHFLFAGNNFGDIFVFSINSLQKISDDYSNKITPKSSAHALEPSQIFNVGDCAVSSLSFHKDFLIVGTVGKITGYKWDDEKFQLGKVAWSVNIPLLPESVESTDINFLALDKDNDLLYAGCGDNLCYCINLDDATILRSFEGHKDYIHSVSLWDGKIYTASEDGTILFWSPKSKEPVGKIEPYKQEKLMRPEYGKWQGTVSVVNDWLLCGGGPRASMWHLRSMECTNVLAFPGKAHCSGFIDDLIFMAGEYNFVHQYSFNGDLSAEIPSSGAAVYSLLWQNEPLKFMSIAGASNALDICTNFNYKDIVVKLYKK